MYGPRGIEPSRGGDLVARDQRPCALGKDLSSTTRTTSHAGITQLSDDPFQRLARDFREEVKFDHRERLEVNRREAALQSAEKVQVVVERQFRIQTADDVELRQGV